MISTSAAMRDIYALVEKVAPIDCNVLIQGESGTGKGLLAKAVHRKSPRSWKPFVVVDCVGDQGRGSGSGSSPRHRMSPATA